MTNKFRAAALALIVFIILNCTTMAQKSGEILDGTAFREKIISVYRNDKTPKSELRKIINDESDEYLAFSSEKYPGLRIIMSIPTENGRVLFNRAEILSSHIHGWNELSLDLYGEGVFYENDAWGIFELSAPVQRLDITRGRIRYKDNRIGGQEALEKLKDRRERIIGMISMPEFQKLSDSDTLSRDREEAMDWIYIEYDWDRIIDSINQTPFYKIK